MTRELARHTDIARADESAHSAKDTFEANTGRTDAVSAGLVRKSDAVSQAQLKGACPSVGSIREVLGRAARSKGTQEGADAGDQAADNIIRQTGTALQSNRNMRSAIIAGVATEMDEADETEGTGKAYSRGKDATSLVRRVKAAAKAERGGASGKASSEAVASKAKTRMQSSRSWMHSRALQEKAAQAAGQTAAKAGGAKTLAAIASSALTPLAGVLAGIIAFVLAIMLVSQLISALFGFWENETYKASLAGLPPYITYEMVMTALECQDEYGHPAGCTIAQIICESGVGDHLSGLAQEDNNLFGIKWDESFALAPEVTGHSSWQTGEEYDGEHVTIMAEFTSFRSHEACIVFRSRILLQSSRYADNVLIQEAIATHSSDKMAEGLKNAGYATSSSYVESLKSIMATYNLYRFDSMTAEQFKQVGISADAIVAAAQSQLGVPYVWGGTTPNVGLDCSGLTQYCYSCAGISIPRNSEAQATAGQTVLLSEARPGDILWRSGHVAIYIGSDSYIHAPQTGDVVRISQGIAYFTCAVRFR